MTKLLLLRQLLKQAGIEYVVTRVEGGTVAHLNVYVGDT